MNVVSVDVPRPGDWALHVSGNFEEHMVHQVDVEKGLVWLLLHSTINDVEDIGGPFPVGNYTFTRCEYE